MWKTLLVLAVTANSFFISPSKGSFLPKLVRNVDDVLENSLPIPVFGSTSIQTSSSSWSKSSNRVSSNSTSTDSSSSSSSGSRSSVQIKIENKTPPDDCEDEKCTKPNEVYDPCPALCPPRECGVDITVILCPIPPKPGDSKCKPGCRCKDGFLKNSSGICVNKNDCPPKCGINEMYDSCANSGCRRWNCSQPEICIDTFECKPGCVCKDDYARAGNGTCIPEDQCESQCASDERYEECPDNLCTPQSCSQLGFPINCPALSGNTSTECPGEPGCVCDNDKVRDDSGCCIPKDQCPSCGGDPNAVAGCGINCGRLCSNYKKRNVPCPLICKLNGCDCRKGYVYDENLCKCVLPENCTPVCGQNETYSNCSNGGCGPRTCDQLGNKIGCVKMDQKYCQGGCICQDGYVKDDSGKCILKTDCPPVCGENEIYSNCSNGGCGPRTCDQLGNKIGCVKMDQKYCQGGCICQDGYVKDDSGKCILKTDCPECGGDPNAVAGCGVNCGQRCSDLSKEPNEVSCIEICYEDACDCRKGFVLDENTGKCVLPEDCTPTCGVNEVYDACANGGCRRWNCSQPTMCIDPLKCKPGCVCQNKYSRADNGTCIPEEQCETQCPKGEIYEECPDNLCTPQSCSQLGFPIQCPALSGKNSSECPGEPGCICDNDKVRDDDGNCIPKDQCPSCGGDPNAVTGCGINCGRRCSNYKMKNVACPLICKLNSCDCRKGYVYDDNLGKCILPEDCTLTCGINEMYDTCANGGCRRWNCSEPVICIDPLKCKPGCVCKKDYSRAYNETCIPENQCEKCFGAHEYFACGSACDNVCATLKTQNQTNCPTINKKCTPMCYCEQGYARDDKNVCIPIGECPKPQCPDGERYEDCPGNLCTLQKCSQLGFPLNCTKNPDCPGGPGCVCSNGVRNDDGNCIPINKCPSCGGDPNAQSGCGNKCGKRCSDYNKKVVCGIGCIFNGCNCRDGFVYDDNTKKCVRPKDCTPVCSKDEVYSECINGGCQPKNCSQLGKPVPCIKIDPKYCIKGCLCKDGYLRADNGTCIPEDHCKPTCGPDERYDECPDALCTPQNCSQLGFPIDCVATTPPANTNSTCPGKPGCVCTNGYVKNDKGKCIPFKNCPSCGGDPNAVSGCGVNCGKLCSNYDKGPVPCPKICKVNACDCRDGFVLDQNINKCVRPKECTPICGDDEVYSNCTNGGCQAKNCSQLGKPIPCVKLDPKDCIKGCLCKDGYLRADNGTCIPEDQCKLKCNKPHEYYVECAPTCPPQTCDSIGKIYFCPKQPPDNCNQACLCKDGYYRNENGDCVTKKECKPQCADDEQYEECPDNLCTPQKCSQLGFPLNCNPAANSTECPGEPGCICKDGNVRDDEGKCIPIDECPSCGGDPNAESGCSNHCGNQCSDYNKTGVACPLYCFINGCDCKDGFVYDNNLKQCVRPEDCTPICGNNEVFSNCTNGGCDAKNCSQIGKPVPCVKLDPKDCMKGCLCKDGYLRADNGTCISKDMCKFQCNKPHEYYVACAPTCPPQTCDTIGKRYSCPKQPPDNCEPACRCEDGYYRNDNGDCVTKEECEPQCPDGEQYEDCPDNLCTPQKCSELGFPLNCNPVSDAGECSGGPGCICNDGSVRDDTGKCIPIDKCPSCGGDPNAQSGCGNPCGNQCSDYNRTDVACPLYCLLNGCDCKDGFVYDINLKQCVRPEDCTPICDNDEVYSDCINGGCQAKNCSQLGKPIPCIKIDPKYCIKGCLCKDGYLRDKKGTCVPEDQCNKCYKPHEYYDKCAPSCPPQTCESIGKKYNCPLQPAVCTGACRCEKGYFRNKIGECITKKECLKCRGLHEYFSCGGACDNVCATLYKQNQTNCPIKNVKCNPMCYCEEGYARNYRNVCIPIEQCPKPKCPDGEQYEDCPGNLCTPQKCSELGFPLNCNPVSDVGECSGGPGCICKDGNVRDETGKCIPIDECPSCGGDPNAQSGCGNPCGNQCSDYNRTDVACPLYCLLNGCDCRDGYVHDSNLKQCVRPEDCTPTCGNDEIYSDCINGGCQAKNCSQLGKPIPCIKIDPKYCIKGCLCKEGYLRADNGTCIPEDQCNKCYKPHEYYDKCAPSCPPQTCESIGKKYNCPLQSAVCTGACRCKKGYFRNKIGECITKKECLKCRGLHEYFSCGGACDNVCATLYKQNQTNCPIVNVKCNPKCYCEKGYARNNRNVCIPIDQCPDPKCGDNQTYVKCPAALCEPLTCSEVGFPVACPDIPDEDSCPSSPDCVCENNYVKDDKGNCIPRNKCPSCGGDPNAVSGCGNNCGRRCSDYKKKKKNCLTEICGINACDCKKGYVYDDNLGKCVRPKDCTPTCKSNEVYDACANGGCNKRNCSQVGQPILCIDPIECKGGCVCQEGYLRAKNGTCVPEDKCPDECNKPHEYYDDCAPTCPPQTCESIGKRYSCPKQPPSKCKGACRCDKGYFRNVNGDCVTKEYCKKCTGGHEFFACGGACDNVCTTLNKQNQTNCPIINVVCNPMCYCETGYARDDKKKCIPIDECPAPLCGDDETYNECPGKICVPLKCSELGFPLNCTDNINSETCPGGPGCICDDGKVRDDTGNCIPIDQCPTCGGDPNAQSGCGSNCGKRCSDYQNENATCPFLCLVNGCDCRDGFVYDDNLKTCVRPQDCTRTCGQDEVYSKCTNGGCQAKNCSQLGQPIPCIKIDPKDCIKGCLCKDGYLRADNGTCIPQDQCEPKCKMPHEYYDACAPTCPPQTCESINKKYNCPKQPAVCTGACRCEKGYYRNKIGECITVKECKKCRGPNEYFSCGKACDNVCATLSKQNQTNCPIVNVKCTPMCYCEEGYARNNRNVCIPIDQCPPLNCEDDQKYVKCPAALCEPLTCSEVGFPIACPDLPKDGSCPGPPDCVCKNNYVKDDKGKCIPRKKCPSCGGDPNAVSGCGNYCGKRCSDYKDKDKECSTNCNFNGCDCKTGFVFDDNLEKCVRPKDCSPVCKDNEVYDTCANGGCDNRNCSQLGQPALCIDPIECKGGCVCEKGYLRARNGTCVPEALCPGACKKPHEKYDPCPVTCPPQTCESIGEVYSCPFIPANNTDYCRGDCICEDGYYRNKIGECISKKDCLKCTGTNEYFSCGKPCDIVCATLSNQNKTSCPIKHKKCSPMCYCEDGYARDKNNVCIPIDQCDGLQCADDERYDECPGNLCEPLKCSELGFPLNCTDNIDSKECSEGPGCICETGKVRDDKGNCIPIDQCPSCGGDPNAQSGCGSNCGRRCSDYEKEDAICPFLCLVNGCDCRDGFVYDDNLKMCVRPQDCTPTCGQDEVYSECTNGGCQAKNCSQLGEPIPCVKIDPKDCIKGCLCKDGYLRANNGTCISLDQCEPKCKKPHEYYDACAPTCPPQTCESIDKKYNCPKRPAVCSGACRCKKGYYRNKIGECITVKECKKCRGPNEYFSCGKACDNVCATLSKQNQTNCPIVNVKCTPMCYCEEGYARNNRNVCIPIDQCPAPKCDDDQKYVKCPAALCEPLTCSEVGFPIACPDLPEDGTCPGPPDCVCKNNYVKDDKGNCIPKKECPSCGGDPNAVSGCGNYCGNRCSDYKDKDKECSSNCDFNGCDCKRGFVFDDNLGKCVRPKDCTPMCKENEVYNTCVNGGCDKTNCSQLGQPIICINPIECRAGCVCEKGYLRANNGTCVPEAQCPGACKKAHEKYDPCPVTCPPQTCESIGQEYSCPAIPVDNTDLCSGDCVCEDGYYKNKIGECISKKDCLKCTGTNEYFSCGKPCDNVCATLSRQNKTNCPIKNKKCSPMCYCEDGYARDKNKVCIPIEECSESCKGDPNAIPGCGNCGRHCSNYNQTVFCPAILCNNNSCTCKQNYVYDDNLQKCVQPKDCTPVCTENEVYNSCINGGCQKKNCSQLGKPDVCVRPKVCMKGCLCKDGYLRLDNGTCVPMDECPAFSCGPDERYVKNPSYLCEPQTCAELGFPVNCSSSEISKAAEEPACLCKEGYVRDAGGFCVPKSECPSCGGDPNAKSGCGVKCGNTCNDFAQNVECIEICYTNACDCKEGYVFEEIAAKCVKREDCVINLT